MTMYAFDSEGYIGDVATAKGWADLAELLRAKGNDLLQAFADDGHSVDPQALSETLSQLDGLPDDLSSITNQLVELARSAKDVLIVSDGVVGSTDYAQVTLKKKHDDKDISYYDRVRHPAYGSVSGVPKPLYVCRVVENANDIIAWAKSNGFDTTLPAIEMHVTICYSKAPVDWNALKHDANGVEIPSGARQLSQLGDEGAVVLQFEAPYLGERWQYYLDHGASWDYDAYYAHITISYVGPKDLSSIEPYRGTIKLGPEIFEELVEDWKDEVDEHAQSDKAIDFKQIESNLDGLEERALKNLHASLTEIRDRLIAKVRRSKDLAALSKGLSLPGRIALRDDVLDMMQRAWDAGNLASRRERRSLKREFAGTPPASVTPRNAMKWLRATAFWITDVLSGRLLDEAQGIILRGIKAGRGVGEIADDLFDAFIPYVGNPRIVADEGVLTPYRLETIVRTNTTNAYNHGRLTDMMDPDVVPFLDGIRYSAIIDERTTEVCRFLDGKIFKPGSADIDTLLPPLHFNCRSIVVPVVVGMTIDKKDLITPAEIGRAKSLADARFLSAQEGWRAYLEQQDESDSATAEEADGATEVDEPVLDAVAREEIASLRAMINDLSRSNEEIEALRLRLGELENSEIEMDIKKSGDGHFKVVRSRVKGIS